MNRSDSERIAAVLEKMGHKKTSKTEGADLIIFNICSVRQKAVDKCKNQISRLRQGYGGQTKLKKAKIVLTGCILLKDKQQFSQMVDLILNIKDLPKWPKLLHYFMLSCYVAEKHKVMKGLEYLKIRSNYQTFPKAYVPISFGCNNFCSYCVVPYTRGQEMHRSKNEIIKEIKELLAKKYKQVTLLGENVNNYPNFTGLLKEITKLKGDFTVSFLAANPQNFTDELIDEIAKNPKLEKYLHLPLQSGDNAILKKMRRTYTRGQYLKLVEKIKKQIPGVKIATDIIVGFPGETKKQFQNTVDVFKKVGFYQAYIAKYSPRPSTAAFLLKNNVSEKEKAKREQVLRKLLLKQKTCYKIERSSYFETKPTKLIVIVGQTAAGKTALAVKLAKKFNGEIVSADSRQIYKQMDIGTAKPDKPRPCPNWTRSGLVRAVPHHLIDIIEPDEKFSVVRYQKLAVKAIKDIQKRGKIPFLVGGTAFYIYSVVEGWQFPEMKTNQRLRNELEKKSLAELITILKQFDPERASSIETKNKRRLIRAIEIAKTLGRVPKLEKKPQFGCLLLGLKPEKEQLKQKISVRVDKMMKEGLEEEVKKLSRKYGFDAPGLASVGYQEWKPYFQPLRNLCDRINYATLSKEQVITKIKVNTYQFAKRQMTWFKRDKRIKWVKNYRKAEGLIIDFLN